MEARIAELEAEIAEMEAKIATIIGTEHTSRAPH
jgi:uncharacterized small protein (DUF1192 family)